MLVFLGGAGAGLSALVNIFYELGFDDIVVVDKYKSEISEKLEKKGIKVIIGDGIYNFSDEDIIIYSDAVVSSQDFQKVKNNRKFTYFEFVGEISKRFQTISIAGTHGKTSTTSMLISSLVKANFEELGLGIVGGFVPDLGNKNYFVNQEKKEEIKTIFEKILTPKGVRPTEFFKNLYFVIEADEFNRHFLLLDTYISGITKVDHDHKDIYPTEKDYLDAFKLFINKTRKKVFTNDEELIKKFGQKCKNNLLNQVNLVNQVNLIDFDYIFGEHMKKNASLVLSIMQELGIKQQKALESIKSFKGVWRRQEYIGIMKSFGKNGHNHRGGKIITDNTLQVNSEQGIVKSNTSLQGEIFSSDSLEQSHQISYFKKEKLSVIDNKDNLGLSDKNNILIYTDYAHHPIEIEATYKSFRQNFPDKKLIAVFQPHQLFRFVSYEQDFIKSLKDFDEIYIYDIYSVRENDLIQKLIKERNLNVKTNQEAIKQIGNQIAERLNGKYIDNFDSLIEELKTQKGIAVFMTAGDLDYKIRKWLEEQTKCES